VECWSALTGLGWARCPSGILLQEKGKGKQKRRREMKILFHHILSSVEAGVFLETEKKLKPLWSSLYKQKYTMHVHENADLGPCFLIKFGPGTLSHSKKLRNP
jgi:hypothetical protein